VVLFDSPEQEHRRSKIRRYIISGLAFVVLAVGASWYMLRYYHEKDTARYFLNAVVAGQMQQAYQIWKPAASYSFKDFMDDWGPSGYYGPVKSYRVLRAVERKDASGVDIIVEVSPYEPFPGDNSPKANQNKQIDLWVQFKDQSIGFPPPAL
jgi:hypothetical protein